MIRTIILFTVSVLIFSAIQIGNNFYLNEKPDIIIDLEIDQKKANEKFITAQLLSSSLNRVYQIFIQNLTFNNKGKSEKNDSLDFLNYLTDLLNKLEIKILSIKPKSSEKRGNNLYNPYEIDIKSSYEKFGKFITKLEQTTRLIEIEEITLNNGLERIRSTNRGEQLQTQDYTLIISTISLNKVGRVKKNIQNLISNELDKNQDTDINENNFKLNHDIPDTSLSDTFQSMIAKIDIDSDFTIYKTNVDSLIINENNQLKSIISVLQEELKKTKLSAQNEINKAKSQINAENDQLLEEINKFRNSLNTTQINIETQLQKSFLLASDENTQLTKIINALQDELEDFNVEKHDVNNKTNEKKEDKNSQLLDEIVGISNLLKNAHTEIEKQLEENLAITRNEIGSLQKEFNDKQMSINAEIGILQEKLNTNNIQSQNDTINNLSELKEENIQLHAVIQTYKQTLENNQMEIEKRLESFLVTFNQENTLLRDEISELQTELTKSKLQIENNSVKEIHDRVITSLNETEQPKSITIAIDGYYKDPSIATRLKAALIDAGYDARIVEVALDNNRLYIIYIGYFEDMKAAQSHSEKLKKHMGIDNTIKSI